MQSYATYNIMICDFYTIWNFVPIGILYYKWNVYVYIFSCIVKIEMPIIWWKWNFHVTYWHKDSEPLFYLSLYQVFLYKFLLYTLILIWTTSKYILAYSSKPKMPTFK